MMNNANDGAEAAQSKSVLCPFERISSMNTPRGAAGPPPLLEVYELESHLGGAKKVGVRKF